MAANENIQPAVSRPERPLFLSAVQFDEALRAGRQSVLDLAPTAVRLGLQGVWSTERPIGQTRRASFPPWLHSSRD
jgi:hypothetical protein